MRSRAGLRRWLLSAAISAGCGKGSAASDAGVQSLCSLTAPAECPTPSPVYSDVARIIEQRCAQCHGDAWTGNWPLDTYGHVADWQDTLWDNIRTCSMPPPDAGSAITVDERMLILTWIRCGLPE